MRDCMDVYIYEMKLVPAPVSEDTDPAQLDLFGREEDAPAVNHTTQAAKGMEEEGIVTIRSPTLQSGEKFNASSLFRKSRELVSRSFAQREQENDLAR